MSRADDTGDLIRRATAGDRPALERLLLDHYGPLNCHVGKRLPRLLQSTVGVDDIVQQTYVKVFQCIGGYEPREDASFHAWLLAVAENCLRDAVRAQRRKKRGGGKVRAQGIPDEQQSRDVQLVDALIGSGNTPSRSVARREGRQAIQSAIAELPEDHRRAIQLRYFDGYSLEESAVLMGRTTGAVRGLVDRARKQIRDALGRASKYLSEK
ncbi:MAG: sigma-70 family RNA polymerase sigma factor [Pirellulales bacterium]